MDHSNEANEGTEAQNQESELLDFTKPDYVFEPKEQHEWRQRGPYLVCKSCELEHAVYIGMEKLLTGLNEDGTPILKPRV